MAQIEVYRVQPEDVDPVEARAVVRDEEAHHLLRVRRATPGDQLILIDGMGSAWNAVFDSAASKTEALCSLKEHLERWGEPTLKISLGLGVLKADKFMDAVDQAVQTGVYDVTPLVMRHNVASWSRQRAEKTEKRALNAAKQTARGLVPAIHDEQPLLSWCIEKADTAYRFYCDPEGDEPVAIQEGSEIALIIGPEGGFHEDEIAFLKDQNWTPISLGPRRLRTETAVPVALALLHSAETEHKR